MDGHGLRIFDFMPNLVIYSSRNDARSLASGRIPFYYLPGAIFRRSYIMIYFNWKFSLLSKIVCHENNLWMPGRQYMARPG
jgi:hypothetical protein